MLKSNKWPYFGLFSLFRLIRSSAQCVICFSLTGTNLFWIFFSQYNAIIMWILFGRRSPSFSAWTAVESKAGWILLDLLFDLRANARICQVIGKSAANYNRNHRLKHKCSFKHNGQIEPTVFWIKLKKKKQKKT